MPSLHNLAIRIAGSDDFLEWFHLYEAVAAEGAWIGGEAPVDRAFREAVFDRYLESEDAVTFLAEIDQQLVGNLGAEIRGGVAHIGMMIDADWRGRGVGSSLMESCLKWASEHRAHKVSLEVWPHNVAAISLYRKFGFEEEGRLRRHYRRRNGELWDAIVMGRVLDLESTGNLIDARPS